MTDLFEMREAIQAQCQQIAGIQTVATLPQRMDGLVLPALLLDCVELTQAQDLGTGELRLESFWALRLVVSEQQSMQSTMALLQAVLQTLSYQRWGLSQVEPAQLKQATLDHFTPHLQGHHLWLIEWTQIIALGESIWDASDIVPTTLVIAHDNA